MGLLVLYVGIGGVAKLSREAALAWRLGVSQLTDAYSFLVTTSTWMVSLWFSVAMVILVPVIARAKLADNDAEYVIFRRELGGLTLASAAAFSIVNYAGILLFTAHGSGFSAHTNSLIIGMLPGMSVSVLLGVLVGIHSVWMLASSRHANTLMEAIPPFVFVGVVLMAESASPSVLVLATLAGIGIQLFVISRLSEYGGGWPTLRFRAIYWKGMGHGLLAMVLGQVVMGLTTLVDQSYASHLDEGSATILNYASRYQVIVLAVIAMVVTRATLPVFSRVSADDNSRSARMALGWAAGIFVVSGVSAAFMWWLFPLLVNSVLGHGQFSAANVSAVVEVARVGVWQTPFYASAMALTSYVSSVQRYHLLLVSGILALVVKVAGNHWLGHLYGLRGLVAATVLVYALNFVYFLALAVRHGRAARHLSNER